MSGIIGMYGNIDNSFKFSGKIKYIFTELSGETNNVENVDLEDYTAIASTDQFASKAICQRIIHICEEHGFNMIEQEYHQSTVDIEVDKCQLLREYLLQMGLINELNRCMNSIFNTKPIAFDDIFIVKYDMNIQQYLPRHFDSGHISFMIALSDRSSYEGGGTSFDILKQGNCTNSNINDTNITTDVDTDTDSYNIVHLNIGELLLFNADLYHCGHPIVSGTRYVLVGFCYVYDDVHRNILGKNSGNINLNLQCI